MPIRVLLCVGIMRCHGSQTWISAYLASRALRAALIMHILHTVLLHFRSWQGRIVYQRGASSVIDHFLYSRDLQVWFSGDTLRKELDAIHSRLVTTTNNNCVLQRNSDLRLILLLHISQWCDVWETITIQLKEK